MASPLEDLLKSYGSLCQQWLDLSQPFVASMPEGVTICEKGLGAETAVISKTLFQALSVASTSSLSYAYSIQSIISKFQASLLEHGYVNEDANHKRALLIDDLRALLREVGESAFREGRHIQHQLMLLTEQLAQAEAQAKQG